MSWPASVPDSSRLLASSDPPRVEPPADVSEIRSPLSLDTSTPLRTKRTSISSATGVTTIPRVDAAIVNCWNVRLATTPLGEFTGMTNIVSPTSGSSTVSLFPVLSTVRTTRAPCGESVSRRTITGARGGTARGTKSSAQPSLSVCQSGNKSSRARIRNIVALRCGCCSTKKTLSASFSGISSTVVGIFASITSQRWPARGKTAVATPGTGVTAILGTSAVPSILTVRALGSLAGGCGAISAETVTTAGLSTGAWLSSPAYSAEISG